jgi:hypothetical protein
MRTNTKVFLGLSVIFAIALILITPETWPAILALGMGLVGTTINELPRISDVLLFEEGEEVNWVRNTITIVSGTATCVLGQVMGKITIGAATSAAKAGGNTASSGSLTMDATAPIGVNCKVGIYRVYCVLAAANAGLFSVVDPLGGEVGTVTAAITTGTVFSGDIKFALLAITSHDFVVGDGFDVTVAAGSGKYAQVTPAAVDGSAVAAAVLLQAATPTADVTAVAVVQGPAIFKENGLQWTSGMTAPQKTAAIAQLAAAGMATRVGYGV